MSIFKNKTSVISYSINKEMGSDLYISVDGGEVVVNAPWYLSRKQIQTVIEEKKQWILSKMKEYQQSNNSSINKGTICILGATHQVRLYYKNTKTPSINIVKGNIDVVLPNAYKKVETSEVLKILMEKLYQKVAEQEVERAMEKTRLLLGIAPEDYEIQKLNPEILASCSKEDKKIVISSEIAKFDRNVIDYLILHEFCHLTYKIHTKNFWKIVEKYMPHYEKYEAILKNFSY